MVSVVHRLDAAHHNAATTWLERLDGLYPADDLTRIQHALDWAVPHLEGRRLDVTDEDLLAHTLGAAAIVTNLRLDVEAVLATLLFYTWERLEQPQETLQQVFGPAVAHLVEGLNRLRDLRHLGHLSEVAAQEPPAQASEHLEAVRKMLLSMVEDMRVVLVKLAWRTQSMHYLAQCDDAVRVAVARETMDVFAPLANRLGVWQLKWELEDLSFRYLEPKTYKRIAKLLDERRLDRESWIRTVMDTLQLELKRAGIEAEISGRPKHIYSIYKKMQRKHIDFSEVYDVRAVRILVQDLKDCYTALGIVHALWLPIPKEFDDYISRPKGNHYQSLHTAVIGPDDKALEVQIRTVDMHRHAELGVAAHWRYKEGGTQDKQYEEKIAWLRQVLEWRDEVLDGADLADRFRTELFQDTVYVLSPQGRVVALHKGSTPVDFAYHIHTDLGHRCRGAKVDGQIVPLNTPLQNGQRVEILAAKQGGPSLDWLRHHYVVTPRAISKIRAWVRAQHQDVALEAGRQQIDKEASRQGIAAPDLDQVARALQFGRVEDLIAAVGRGEVGSRQLAMALRGPARPAEPAPAEAGVLLRDSQAERAGQGILIEGVANLMTVLAQCCRPLPGDPVIGFVTQGRGVSIHRQQCPTVKRLSERAPERLIEASWGQAVGARFAADLVVEAADRPGLLRDISEVFSRQKVNVTGANTLSRHQQARMKFTVEVPDNSQLQRLVQLIHDVPGVQRVTRSLG